MEMNCVNIWELCWFDHTWYGHNSELYPCFIYIYIYIYIYWYYV